MIQNPIIEGFNPDPSVTFDGEYYYLVTSTFEFAPGVNLYRSKDLKEWKYIRGILDDDNLLRMHSAPCSTGIYAPTIRYNNGFYYMVTTNKNGYGNFVVWTDDVNKKWNGPYFIRRGGIDPSLFFDDDGSCFYCSNGVTENTQEKGILGFFINPKTGEKLSEEYFLSAGITGRATEGPHIYKENGYYYLMMAEGGTGITHSEIIARSLSLLGPYDTFSPYPLLGHVNRKGHTIQNTGHAELFKAPSGKWYAVFLAVRTYTRKCLHTLGRETFMAPVNWKDGWPIIGNDGYVELEMPDELETKQDRSPHFDFSNPLESQNLLKLRTFNHDNYLLDTEKKELTLLGNESILSPLSEPTMLLSRVRNTSDSATVTIKEVNGTAGLAAYYSYAYAFVSRIRNVNGEYYYEIVRSVHDLRVITLSEKVTLPVTLKTESGESEYITYLNGEEKGRCPAMNLSSDNTMYMSFTGTMFALFAEKGEAKFS